MRAGDGDVFLRVMGAAERRIDHAGAHADHGDRQVLIAEIVAHHLERPIEREGRDRIGEGLAALEREAGADADHALLGDADIDEALGILLAELRHAAGRRDVGDDDVDVGIGAGRLVERLGERVSHTRRASSSTHGLLVFRLVGRAVVPDRHVLHVADALALGGLGDHHQRLPPLREETAAKMAAESWPSTSTRFPAERRELVGQRIERRMRLGGAAEALEVVVVDDGDDVGAAERGRHQHGLPGRAFLDLAVAQHGVDDRRRSCGRARPAPCRPPSTGRGRASRSRPRCRDCRSRDGRRAGRPACNSDRDPRVQVRRAPPGSRTGSCSRDPSTSGRCRARCRRDCGASARGRCNRRSRCRNRPSRCAERRPAATCRGSAGDSAGSAYSLLSHRTS